MWSKGVRLVRGRERRMTRHSSKSRNNMRMLRKLQRMITPDQSQVADPDFLFEQTAAYISLLQSHVSSLKKIIHHVQQKKLN
ncbi:hypothetical protein DCAR_0626351 [Daucus carota subsp. sativus]|uniref:Uncharacterized protein n=1 Tax=Daucus carota subsp. sativus TaxID=79200 RepID=A0AAF1B7Q1_DAUCS|nr:hypothetical protein DCAR_0626351 [Daucus carota subsp. sativus]